jgi:DNA-binding transcriptional MerR regulator
MYRIQEFAAKAGVTVRTLHHYDRIGLLKPKRTHTRYRVYSDADLPRLQQILVLKFVGVPLARIADALKSGPRLNALVKTLRYAVKRKRARLGVELHLLDELDGSIGAGPDWSELASFVGEMNRLSGPAGSPEKPELDEARRIIAERQRAWSLTLRDYELNRDIRAAIARGDTPDTPAGQALVARWREGIERFVGGDEKVRAAFQLVMADRSSWPNAPGRGEFQEYFDRALKQAS